jgi:hypothetical protein
MTPQLGDESSAPQQKGNAKTSSMIGGMLFECQEKKPGI